MKQGLKSRESQESVTYSDMSEPLGQKSQEKKHFKIIINAKLYLFVSSDIVSV